MDAQTDRRRVTAHAAPMLSTPRSRRFRPLRPWRTFLLAPTLHAPTLLAPATRNGKCDSMARPGKAQRGQRAAIERVGSTARRGLPSETKMQVGQPSAMTAQQRQGVGEFVDRSAQLAFLVEGA